MDRIISYSTIEIIKSNDNIVYELNLGSRGIFMLSLINKDKIRADNLIMIVILLSFLVTFFTVDKIVITALFVYPIMAFLTQGVIHIYKGLNKKVKILSKVLLGICEIIFCMFMLGYIIFQPTVGLRGIVVLFAYPLVLTGFAGLIKGILIDAYTLQYRIINGILGIATIILSLNAIIFSEIWFLGHLVILLVLLILNIIFRFALYLSEFGLSIKHLENFRVVFLIIDGYFLKLASNEEESDERNA